MPEKWKRIDSRVVEQTRIFRLRQDRSVSPRSGAAHDFFVLELPEWINVIALTEAGRVVFIRQYRHGSGEITLEIPGGMVDPGEAPSVAAARELREETGYVARRWLSLGCIEPNPAFQTNRCHTFLAEGAYPAGASDPDDAEEIDVEEIELERVPGLLADGTITHALVGIAFQKLELHRRGLLRAEAIGF